MTLQLYTIVKDDESYPGIDKDMPPYFHVSGVTPEQAGKIAEKLSDHNPGCDYSWYVERSEDDY